MYELELSTSYTFPISCETTTMLVSSNIESGVRGKEMFDFTPSLNIFHRDRVPQRGLKSMRANYFWDTLSIYVGIF